LTARHRLRLHRPLRQALRHRGATPLCLDDLLRLELGVEAIAPSGKPVVIPTDRKLAPHDVPALRDIGIRNFLIGYAVTGGDVASITQATRTFREALDRS
jgi:hypothetical protein